MTNTIEKRNQPRIDIKWPIKIFASHGTFEGETKNISSEGILICCEEPLNLNEIYLISIIPPLQDAIGFSGRVIWSDFYGICDKNNPVCIGFCLVEISEKDRHLFNNLLTLATRGSKPSRL
ncbi:MAG: PilZ domain-containing protein [Pseudomonadota bacterium]